MAICPKCRAKGAIVESISCGVDGIEEIEVYCDFCENTSFSPANEDIAKDLIDEFYSKMVTEPHRLRQPHKEYGGAIYRTKQEEPTMKVSYNGFTGELVKLERKTTLGVYVHTDYHIEYDLSIYDHEKKVTHSFTNVNMKDVEFLGGSVSFE